MSKVLAIIGTAGRGPDGARLTPGYYRSMITVSQVVAAILEPDTLVSGGAAVSDHIAVRLYLDGHAPNLSLHLPAPWLGHGFKESGGQYDTGRTSNWYHTQFSAAQGIDSLADIQAAIEKGARVTIGTGFKERNSVIAREADLLLAFTFGDGPVLKDGGTKDTWDKFLARRDICVTPLSAYHFCLNRRQLYSL